MLSTLLSLLLLGGWHGTALSFFISEDQAVAGKAVFLFMSVLLVRAALPRTRMRAALSSAWSSLLPAAINGFLFYLWVIFIVGALPFTDLVGIPARYRGAVKTLLRGVLFNMVLWGEFVEGQRDVRKDTSLGRRWASGDSIWPQKSSSEVEVGVLPTIYNVPEDACSIPSQLWPRN